MPRCCICDYDYELHFLSVLEDNDYCPVCEGIILGTIQEMETEELEEDEDEATHCLPS